MPPTGGREYDVLTPMTNMIHHEPIPVARALAQVLSPRRLAEVRELVAADCSCAPQAADVLKWMRLHMPVAAFRVDCLTQLDDLRD